LYILGRGSLWKGGLGSGAFCKKLVYATNTITLIESTANLAIRLVPFVPHADAKDSLN